MKVLARHKVAVGALVTRDVGPAFARAMRPWVLGAWILTLLPELLRGFSDLRLVFNGLIIVLAVL